MGEIAILISQILLIIIHINAILSLANISPQVYKHSIFAFYYSKLFYEAVLLFSFKK